VDLVARIGTAVTLVAMTVVLASAYVAFEEQPVTAGVATVGR
jgi:hypothetical protein